MGATSHAVVVEHVAVVTEELTVSFHLLGSVYIWSGLPWIMATTCQG